MGLVELFRLAREHDASIEIGYPDGRDHVCLWVRLHGADSSFVELRSVADDILGEPGCEDLLAAEVAEMIENAGRKRSAANSR